MSGKHCWSLFAVFFHGTFPPSRLHLTTSTCQALIRTIRRIFIFSLPPVCLYVKYTTGCSVLALIVWSYWSMETHTRQPRRWRRRNGGVDCFLLRLLREAINKYFNAKKDYIESFKLDSWKCKGKVLEATSSSYMYSNVNARTYRNSMQWWLLLLLVYDRVL